MERIQFQDVKTERGWYIGFIDSLIKYLREENGRPVSSRKLLNELSGWKHVVNKKHLLISLFQQNVIVLEQNGRHPIRVEDVRLSSVKITLGNRYFAPEMSVDNVDNIETGVTTIVIGLMRYLENNDGITYSKLRQNNALLKYQGKEMAEDIIFLMRNKGLINVVHKLQGSKGGRPSRLIYINKE